MGKHCWETGHHPEAKAESALGLRTTPVSGSPIWTKSQAASVYCGLTCPYPGPPHPGGEVQSQELPEQGEGRKKVEPQREGGRAGRKKRDGGGGHSQRRRPGVPGLGSHGSRGAAPGGREREAAESASQGRPGASRAGQGPGPRPIDPSCSPVWWSHAHIGCNSKWEAMSKVLASQSLSFLVYGMGIHWVVVQVQ